LFDALTGFTAKDAAETSYTRELPLLATADYYDFLDHVLRYDLSDSERARIRQRSRNYQQFLRLLAALERAEALQARVLLDCSYPFHLPIICTATAMKIMPTIAAT